MTALALIGAVALVGGFIALMRAIIKEIGREEPVRYANRMFPPRNPNRRKRGW